MTTLEIEEAISALAGSSFDHAEFPYAFLEAFGNKTTTLKRLRSTGKASTNHSDIRETYPHAVLQRNNVHLTTCPPGETLAALDALRLSSATSRQKAKYILATDGTYIEAENLAEGESLACDFPDLANHFGFFLPLAGITTVRAIRENAFDIKATNRLNKLYLELLHANPDWTTDHGRQEFNHFMARLIFCYYAEDTDIFIGDNLFTATIEQMSTPDGSNTHDVLAQCFRAMNTPLEKRAAAKLRPWADTFPYVNGGLFGEGTPEVPRFTKIARTHLLHVGRLDWTKINPDIFGSMIQAIADEDERSFIGMHYTSVPNILKVLNPLFLDNLRTQLETAADNKRKLLNLRNRLARIRVFDPACGSGNFLVIAYKEMRAIEAEINRRRGEPDRHSAIPLTNFRGIELRHFSAEVARLALVIAEYQCNVLHIGQKEAKALFLPLEKQNWITCGNALRLDWLSICPPGQTAVKTRADDLFESPLDQTEINFANQGGETYICGNPPYKGSTYQTAEQKADLQLVFEGRATKWKSLDYVTGWFMKAAEYSSRAPGTASAFVATNSICQGQQVPILWPALFESGHRIHFAHRSFKWANLAAHNAGVTVAIVGITAKPNGCQLFHIENKESVSRYVEQINAYLVPGQNIIVNKANEPLSDIDSMDFGNKAVDQGNLILLPHEIRSLGLTEEQEQRFIRPFLGSREFIRGESRYCLWIPDEHLEEAQSIPTVAARIEKVRQFRLASRKKSTRESAADAHKFTEIRQRGDEVTIIVPRVSSESRAFLPCGYLPAGTIISDLAFALYDAPLWNLALIASRLHLVWIATVCGKLETRYRYSNTLGWNTFPVPRLTAQNKEDLTHCANHILLARERHFPDTIADLYDPKSMPENLFHAHRQNDETLERIYIGRLFKNDTERLEHLFHRYTEMTMSSES